MGFLNNSTIGFGGITFGGGSGNLNDNTNQFTFIDVPATIGVDERFVASSSAANNIQYTLPTKISLEDGSTFKFVNMNAPPQEITITDEESFSRVLIGGESIILVLDKSQNAWQEI